MQCSIPMSKVVRGLFRVPKFGNWLSRQRLAARVGWQANRLAPDEIIGPLSAQFSAVELWRNPKSSIDGREADIRTFEGINRAHYWVIATVR